MAEHTPTPWYAMASVTGWQVRASGTLIAAMMTPTIRQRQPNARFIVRAVNCHEALVRELEDCELSLKLDVDEWGSPRLKGTLANIRAALAKAKEGTVDESQMLLRDLDEETL